MRTPQQAQQEKSELEQLIADKFRVYRELSKSDAVKNQITWGQEYQLADELDAWVKKPPRNRAERRRQAFEDPAQAERLFAPRGDHTMRKILVRGLTPAQISMMKRFVSSLGLFNQWPDGIVNNELVTYTTEHNVGLVYTVTEPNGEPKPGCFYTPTNETKAKDDPNAIIAYTLADIKLYEEEMYRYSGYAAPSRYARDMVAVFVRLRQITVEQAHDYVMNRLLMGFSRMPD